MSNYRSGYPQNRRYPNSKYSDNKQYDSGWNSAKRDNLLVQISGPDRHDKRDPSSISRACFESSGLVDQNNQLRLILGIKANGASEFLVPAQFTTRLLYDVKRLESASDPRGVFISYSHVTFSNVRALGDSLKEHMNGKNGRVSKANKAYQLVVIGNRATEKESLRCQYEYPRTIIRHMTLSLPYPPSFYAISEPPEGEALLSEFLLFTCNDYKVGLEGGFLDTAWGYVDSSAIKEKAGEPYRIKPHVGQDINFQNDMFAGARIREVCKDAPTLDIGTPEDDRIALREHLRTSYKRSSRPICFVVHDWKRAKKLLGEMHIDTSTWCTNLRPILQITPSKSEYSQYQEDMKPSRDKSRSRSPPRRGHAGLSSNPVKYERDSLDTRIKSDPNPTRPSRAPELQVHVIDTKALYSTVRRSGNLIEDLVNACRDFDLPEVEEVPQNHFCAGNELRYLWALFIKMADGPTIDEMYRTQFKDKNMNKQVGDEDEDEDEDEGPSNTGFVAPRLAPSTSQRKDPYDFQNDECDDESE